MPSILESSIERAVADEVKHENTLEVSVNAEGGKAEIAKDLGRGWTVGGYVKKVWKGTLEYAGVVKKTW